MIDSVIAGTGNSRFLRTSISASTTWEDALTMLRAGTFPIDLAGINIDGYITVGTPLNAETLLKEAVITALDLDDNATPSDAWEKLIAIVNTKADADSVVTAITYDSAEKKLYATIDGTPTLVTTFNFTTPQEAADAAPVQSVAGRTGNVTLTADDVAYDKNETYTAGTVGKALTDDDARMGEIEGDITDINNELDAFEKDVEDNYARIDGYYEEMTVGNAEQLVATVGIDDNAPYLFRTTGGSADVGDRKTMELVGGTVAWNQQIKYINTDNFRVIGADGAISDNLISINGNVTVAERWTIPAYSGHVYYLTFDYKNTLVGNSKVWFYLNNPSMAFNIPSSTNFARFDKLVTISVGRNNSVNFITDSYESGELDIKNFMLIDLTQMFGSSIAGYVYSIEQAHVGDGVAWFKKLFPKDYYAYNVGTLMSVKTSANITTGFNAYNHAEGVAKLVGGNAYQITGTYTALSYSTGETITPDESGYFTPSDSGALTVTGGDATTTCVHLVWDGERDGEYESYVEHNYPLDSDLELRGISKLDENNSLYYDGDVYTSDGTITRKYGVKVFTGDESFATWGTNGLYTNIADIAIKPQSETTLGWVFSNKWPEVTQTQAGGQMDVVAKTAGNTAVVFKNANASDAATFKTYLAAQYNAGTPLVLIYKLATPKTEESTPFTSPEIVDDFGTEQYVDTRAVPVPVGHNSVYQANLRAKLEMAPDSPDGDGDYLVRQSNGTNAYVPYIIPTAGQVNFDDTEEYDDGSVGAELNRKADADGYYETLTAGLSENLVTTVGVDDSVPYNFRTTGGNADVGDRKEMTVVGGTVAWNQLVHDTEASNTTSGDIVEIDDAKAVPFESIKAVFEPQQDLHGYDAPWPAGGGKNKCPTPIEDNVVYRNGGYLFTITFNNGVMTWEITGTASTYFMLKAFTIAQEHVGKTYTMSFSSSPEIDMSSTASCLRLWDSATQTRSSLNSRTATITEDMVGKDLCLAFYKSGEGTFVISNCQLEEGSSATTFAPFENVCPISGYTGAEVGLAAENLFDQSQILQATGWAVDENGYYYGTRSAWNLAFGNGFPINPRFKPNTRYTISCMAYNSSEQSSTTIGFMYSDGTRENCLLTGTAPSEFSLTSSSGKSVVAIRGTYGSNGDVITHIKDIMLVEGMSVEEYVAYVGQTIPVSWQTEAGEVIGGYYDAVSGKLRAEWSKRKLSALEWTYQPNQVPPRFYTASIGNSIVAPTANSVIATALCECYRMNSYSSYSDKQMSIATSGNIFIKDSSYVDVETLMAAVGDYSVAYKLENPIEYTLTPTQVTALLGTNIAWNDIGTTELTYKSDNDHITLINGRKYFTHINGTDSFVAGNGQEAVAMCGRDNVFDLSQMFGPNIATYLGGISATDAVNWFRKLFPKLRYAYDEGSLQSVQTSANVTTGLNQWDEVWEQGNINGTTGENAGNSDTMIRSKNYIPVIPSTQYFINQTAARIFMYDAQKNYLNYGNITGTFTTYANCHFIRFRTDSSYGAVYKNDICINIRWDGERDGEYEPYDSRTYSLDSDLMLRGVPKLDAYNSLYYDGDVYESDGTVTRKYGVITFDGTEPWDALGTNRRWWLRHNAYPQIAMSDTTLIFIANKEYMSGNRNTMIGKTIASDATNNAAVVILDTAFTTVDGFKQHLADMYAAGKPLVAQYILTTETTETADPYEDFMVVNDFGTEEFVDVGVTSDPPTRDVAIPVGHTTVYAANLRAKLEMAPDSPDGDGDYIVRQTNGENAYVLLEKELPAAPTANGTYILKVVINNGTATYSWEAQT